MVNCGSSLRSSWIKEKVRQKMHLFWLSWLSLAGWESLVVWRKKESLRENCGGDRSQVIMLHRGLVSVWGISVSLDVIHIPIISHYTYNELKSKFAKEKKVFICMHQKDQINFSRYSIPFLQCFRPYKSNIFCEQCSLSIWPNSTDDWSLSQLAPSLRSHSQLVFHSTGPYSSASVQLVPQAPGPRINWSLESTSPPVIVYWSPSQLVHY